MDKQDLLSPAELRMRACADANRELFNRYIEFRIRGRNPIVCLRMVFGDAYVGDGQGFARVYGLESNSYFIDKFRARLKEIDFSELWNPKDAIHLLMTIAYDDTAKDQARLNAIAHLNVLSGITIVDSAGSTKAVRGLNDFYNDIGALPGENNAPTSDQSGDATKH